MTVFMLLSNLDVTSPGVDLLGSLDITSPGVDHVKSLRRVIDRLSTVRRAISLLHDAADGAIEYQVKCNATGLTLLSDFAQLMATDDIAARTADRAPVNDAPWGSYTGTATFANRSSAPVPTITPSHPDLCPAHGVAEMHIRWPLSTFRQIVQSTEHKAFPPLGLIVGMLAVLCHFVALVLTAISRHPNARAFVLVMLAACLRYGHRDDPDHHAFLSIRRNLTFLGSCPTF